MFACRAFPVDEHCRHERHDRPAASAIAASFSYSHPGELTGSVPV